MDFIKDLDGGFSVIGNVKVSGAREGKYGVTIILCPNSTASAVFTSNKVVAAPVKYTKNVVKNGKVSAVFVNSGNANCFTGEQGIKDCETLVELVSRDLKIPKEEIAISSTGVIGREMPIDIISKVAYESLSKLGSEPENSLAAAKAIMTTDTMPKEVAVSFEIDGVTVTVGGMCKGSGMIHPNMCTMLGFVMTDVSISKELLTQALKEDVQDTYNMVSVDGDTSTNDTVLLFANGMAGNKEITSKDENYKKFKEALHYVNEELAKMIAGDGEGATALFEVKVIGAENKEQAVTLSKSVVTSSLTKAAIYGHDANWGRILCALGYSGVQFDPEKVDLYFESAAGKLKIIENGVSTGYSEEVATKILSEEEVTAIADMKMGTYSATAWGCDLTYDYVKINADYRS